MKHDIIETLDSDQLLLTSLYTAMAEIRALYCIVDGKNEVFKVKVHSSDDITDFPEFDQPSAKQACIREEYP